MTKLRIFLADDHVMVRTGLKTLINSEPDMQVIGEAANGRMPGKIYICLPDENKSFVAGTFDAEIRKPPPPKPPKPKG